MALGDPNKIIEKYIDKKNGKALFFEEFRERVLAFLTDEKEIMELMMVLDEQLKQMCRLCASGKIE